MFAYEKSYPISWAAYSLRHFIKAKIAEVSPCTATRIDVIKSSFTDRMPNHIGKSPNVYLPCGTGSTEDSPEYWKIRPAYDSFRFRVIT
ncbi:MAG: hypothetical protein ACOYOA_15570 [Saprospiraceae bacterium]